jgi:hypothetical protein
MHMSFKITYTVQKHGQIQTIRHSMYCAGSKEIPMRRTEETYGLHVTSFMHKFILQCSR